MPKLPLAFRDRFALFAKTISGSECIDELSQTETQRSAKKADFFFENRRIICELKNLETDTSPKIEKLLKPLEKRPEWPRFRDARRLALGVNEWENFVRHIGVVLRLHPTAMEGVRSLVCERIALHAVDGEDSDSPLVQVRAEGADHALTFLLPFVATARREREEGHTEMAVSGDAHVAVETV